MAPANISSNPCMASRRASGDASVIGAGRDQTTQGQRRHPTSAGRAATHSPPAAVRLAGEALITLPPNPFGKRTGGRPPQAWQARGAPEAGLGPAGAGRSAPLSPGPGALIALCTAPDAGAVATGVSAVARTRRRMAVPGKMYVELLKQQRSPVRPCPLAGQTQGGLASVAEPEWPEQGAPPDRLPQADRSRLRFVTLLAGD